ncbi:MAG: PC4/YdbC family ssDNA-binding protein [Clostridia bacterium]|nr:PC4/YdbC family ssDNA-binding protein [Clostridia bacterium]
MNEIKCEIVRDVGVLSENGRTGWRKMLRIVKWNGNAEKYDLHDWSPDDSKSGKSGTLTVDEAKALLKLLQAEFEGADG